MQMRSIGRWPSTSRLEVLERRVAPVLRALVERIVAVHPLDRIDQALGILARMLLEVGDEGRSAGLSADREDKEGRRSPQAAAPRGRDIAEM